MGCRLGDIEHWYSPVVWAYAYAHAISAQFCTCFFRHLANCDVHVLESCTLQFFFGVAFLCVSYLVNVTITCVLLQKGSNLIFSTYQPMENAPSSWGWKGLKFVLVIAATLPLGYCLGSPADLSHGRGDWPCQNNCTTINMHGYVTIGVLFLQEYANRCERGSYFKHSFSR